MGLPLATSFPAVDPLYQLALIYCDREAKALTASWKFGTYVFWFNSNGLIVYDTSVKPKIRMTLTPEGALSLTPGVDRGFYQTLRAELERELALDLLAKIK